MGASFLLSSHSQLGQQGVCLVLQVAGGLVKCSY